jgi:hypothetical protein
LSLLLYEGCGNTHSPQEATMSFILIGVLAVLAFLCVAGSLGSYTDNSSS